MPPGAGEKGNEKGGKQEQCACLCTTVGCPFCLVTTLVVKAQDLVAFCSETLFGCVLNMFRQIEPLFRVEVLKPYVLPPTKKKRSLGL